MELNLKCKCDICIGYLARCMVEPLRCPGLGCKDGRYFTHKNGKFYKWWDEIVVENKIEQEEKRKEYYKQNKQHLTENGFMEG